jgi:hypothetical protein
MKLSITGAWLAGPAIVLLIGMTPAPAKSLPSDVCTGKLACQPNGGFYGSITGDVAVSSITINFERSQYCACVSQPIFDQWCWARGDACSFDYTFNLIGTGGVRWSSPGLSCQSAGLGADGSIAINIDGAGCGTVTYGTFTFYSDDACTEVSSSIYLEGKCSNSACGQWQCQ